VPIFFPPPTKKIKSIIKLYTPIDANFSFYNMISGRFGEIKIANYLRQKKIVILFLISQFRS